MAFISIELGSEDWKDNPVAVCYGHANEKARALSSWDSA